MAAGVGQLEGLDGAVIRHGLQALVRVRLLHALVDLKYICYLQLNHATNSEFNCPHKMQLD